MIYAVYVPLLIPLLVAPFARPVATHLHPAHAARMLAVLAGVLAACSTVSLVLLAATHWPHFDLDGASPRLPAGANPTGGAVAAAAAVLVLAGALSVAMAALVRRRSLRRLQRAYGGPVDSTADGVDVTVVQSDRPEAFSLPATWRNGGRVVVSTGMLDGLDQQERAVLLAHERSHLLHDHHRLIGSTWAAALLNPFLWPLLRALRFAVERWADEDAATACLDRRLAARTVGRAALLTLSHGRGAPSGRDGVLGITGAVPRRVASLLSPSPPGRQWVSTAGGLVALASALAACEGVRDLGHLFAFWSTT